MNNPFLNFSGLPPFEQLRPELVQPAISQLIQENRALLAQLETVAEPSWQNFVAPLEQADERLSRAWGLVGHLKAVVNSPEWVEAHDACLGEVTRYFGELSQNPALYQGFRQIREGSGFAALSPARQRIVERELMHFRLGGAELNATDKKRFLEIQERLAELSSRFEQNLLDTMNHFTLAISRSEQLEGMPPEVVAAAAQRAKDSGQAGWLLNLHAPCYVPVMQYAKDRTLRQEMYRAYATRASEFGASEWDNSPVMNELLQLRQEEANLLGYANYAEVSLQPKMASTVPEVLDFLRDLARRSRPYAERDWQDLSGFARQELGLETMEPWDVAWVGEQLRQARYAYSDLEVKAYFPEDKVREGLFGLVQKLYGLSAVPAEAALWHPDARFYQLKNAQQQVVGEFYLDLYARNGKQGGAWADGLRARRKLADGSFQIPLSALICNFSGPGESGVAYFTFDDVITLFHEFGHGLHHMLTQVEDLAVSGTHGVEWDAVELPSQFMENFCWEWEVLVAMTRHEKTGLPLPRALFERMVAARHFQSGMQTVRQLEFSLFDMELHAQNATCESPLELLGRIRQEVAVVHPPHWHRFPNSFSHIFAGGYAAGYYSYKWAEVLSSDAYGLFEERGILDPVTGHAFWQEILGTGGSRPAMESFRAFRGREPDISAFLRHNGLSEPLPS
jgi:oligopeptidase A